METCRFGPNNGTNAQKWKVTHDSNGYVTLTSVNSGKALDVNGGVSASGTNVQHAIPMEHTLRSG